MAPADGTTSGQSEVAKVAARVRPFLQREEDLGAVRAVSVQGSAISVHAPLRTTRDTVSSASLSRTILPVSGSSGATAKSFALDRVFWSLDPEDSNYASQAVVNKEIGEPCCDGLLKGYSSCVLAHGQVGTGKTHTLFGFGAPSIGGAPDADGDGALCAAAIAQPSPAAGAPGRRAPHAPRSPQQGGRSKRRMPWGIAVSVLESLCDFRERSRGKEELRIWISLVEVRAERIMDLLHPGEESRELEISDHPELGPVLVGRTEVPCFEMSDALSWLEFGTVRRAMSTSCLRSNRSRSHVMLTVRTERHLASSAASTPATTPGGTSSTSVPSRLAAGGAAHGAAHGGAHAASGGAIPKEGSGAPTRGKACCARAIFVDLAGAELLAEGFLSPWASSPAAAVGEAVGSATVERAAGALRRGEGRAIDQSLTALGHVLVGLGEAQRPGPGGASGGAASSSGPRSGPGSGTPADRGAAKRSVGSAPAAAAAERGGAGGSSAAPAPAPSKAVPFAASVLTRLLKEALSGSYRLYVLACVSPASTSASETLSTLRFASAARRLRTTPRPAVLGPCSAAAFAAAFAASGAAAAAAAAASAAAASLPAGDRDLDPTAAAVTLAFADAARCKHSARAVKDELHRLEAARSETLTKLKVSLSKAAEFVHRSPFDRNVMYLLNVSEDPALCGSLAFLLPSAGDSALSIGGGPDCSVLSRGLAIPPSRPLCFVERLDTGLVRVVAAPELPCVRPVGSAISLASPDVEADVDRPEAQREQPGLEEEENGEKEQDESKDGLARSGSKESAMEGAETLGSLDSDGPSASAPAADIGMTSVGAVVGGEGGGDEDAPVVEQKDGEDGAATSSGAGARTGIPPWEARVFVNGAPLEWEEARDLEHGDELVLGRAAAFRLVVPSQSEAVEASDHSEDLDMTTEAPLDRGPLAHAVAPEASKALQELELYLEDLSQRIGPEQGDELFDLLTMASHWTDEANDITRALRPEASLKFEVELVWDIHREPRDIIVIRLLREKPPAGADESQQEQAITPGVVGYWPLDKFEARLDRMRDAFNEFANLGRWTGKGDHIEDPWLEPSPVLLKSTLQMCVAAEMRRKSISSPSAPAGGGTLLARSPAGSVKVPAGSTGSRHATPTTRTQGAASRLHRGGASNSTRSSPARERPGSGSGVASARRSPASTASSLGASAASAAGAEPPPVAASAAQTSGRRRLSRDGGGGSGRASRATGATAAGATPPKAPSALDVSADGAGAGSGRPSRASRKAEVAELKRALQERQERDRELKAKLVEMQEQLDALERGGESQQGADVIEEPAPPPPAPQQQQHVQAQPHAPGQQQAEQKRVADEQTQDQQHPQQMSARLILPTTVQLQQSRQPVVMSAQPQPLQPRQPSQPYLQYPSPLPVTHYMHPGQLRQPPQAQPPWAWPSHPAQLMAPQLPSLPQLWKWPQPQAPLPSPLQPQSKPAEGAAPLLKSPFGSSVGLQPPPPASAATSGVVPGQIVLTPPPTLRMTSPSPAPGAAGSALSPQPPVSTTVAAPRLASPPRQQQAMTGRENSAPALLSPTLSRFPSARKALTAREHSAPSLTSAPGMPAMEPAALTSREQSAPAMPTVVAEPIAHGQLHGRYGEASELQPQRYLAGLGGYRRTGSTPDLEATVEELPGRRRSFVAPAQRVGGRIVSAINSRSESPREEHAGANHLGHGPAGMLTARTLLTGASAPSLHRIVPSPQAGAPHHVTVFGRLVSHGSEPHLPIADPATAPGAGTRPASVTPVGASAATIPPCTSLVRTPLTPLGAGSATVTAACPASAAVSQHPSPLAARGSLRVPAGGVARAGSPSLPGAVTVVMRSHVVSPSAAKSPQPVLQGAIAPTWRFAAPPATAPSPM